MRPKLIKRILSGIVMLAVSLAIIIQGGTLFLLLLAALTGVAFLEWMQLSAKTNQKYLFSLAGFIYVPLSFYCCFLIRDDFPAIYGLLFVVMIAFSDIGAYMVGKAIGGPKLAKVISPNKTWAGLVGAMLTPALIACAAALLGFVAGGAPVYFALVGLLMGLVGQSGDLLISFVKRKAKSKDAGGIIPGHGGVLDRIDSLMLAAPIYLAILTGWGQFFGLS